MLAWIKNNKKFIIALLLSVLQNVGVVPPATQLVSDVTSPASPAAK